MFTFRAMIVHKICNFQNWQKSNAEYSAMIRYIILERYTKKQGNQMENKAKWQTVLK